MKNNRAVKTTIKKLGINGEGIAYLDKKITFVPGALPGEEVLIDVLRDEPKYKMGLLKNVLSSSSKRVHAKCRMQKDCLGCPLMILDYPSQLESKLELVKDTFKKYVGEPFEHTDFNEVMPSSFQSGIRNIVRLPIVMFNGKLTFGIYQRESKYLTLMTGCMMQSKRINSCLTNLENIMNDMHLSAYDEVKKKGLRFLTVREFDNGLQLIFITGTDKLPDRFINAVSQLEDVASLYVSVNTTRKQDFELARYELKYGKTHMEQIFMQKKFSISSKADFPVYRQHALRVAKTISSSINEDVKKIVDVGCGIGLYSLGLDDKYVIKGIDTSKININDAQNNAQIQHRSQASYEAGKIDQLFTVLSKHYRFDLAMFHLDSFKMSDDLVDSIVASKIKYLIFESDHVSMLAKTVAELTDVYSLDKLVAIDGNPHGPGVSVIAYMTRKR